MSGNRNTEEFKIAAVKQVTERGNACGGRSCGMTWCKHPQHISLDQALYFAKTSG